MNARERILAAVRAGSGERNDASAIGSEAEALLDDPVSIRPALPPGPLPDVFADRVVSPKVGASADRIAQVADFPAAVKRYLDANSLPPAIALQPAAALQGLDWTGFEMHEALSANEAVGVGCARWGIAETGSLVFHSGPDTPILANFLPLHHIVLVLEPTILAYLEDYAAAFAASGEKPPRNVNIITGASGTSDIEGSFVRGAHGPRFLHVVLSK